MQPVTNEWMSKWMNKMNIKNTTFTHPPVSSIEARRWAKEVNAPAYEADQDFIYSP